MGNGRRRRPGVLGQGNRWQHWIRRRSSRVKELKDVDSTRANVTDFNALMLRRHMLHRIVMSIESQEDGTVFINSLAGYPVIAVDVIRNLVTGSSVYFDSNLPGFIEGYLCFVCRVEDHALLTRYIKQHGFSANLLSELSTKTGKMDNVFACLLRFNEPDLVKRFIGNIVKVASNETCHQTLYEVIPALFQVEDIFTKPAARIDRTSSVSLLNTWLTGTFALNQLDSAFIKEDYRFWKR